MLRRFLPLMFLSISIGFAQEAKQPNQVPKGETFTFPFAKSKIFPGTTRSVTVYVPKQYDGTTPACVYVNQDGVPDNVPGVFDKLIAEKAMPVTIGVFVMPGVVKAADGKTALDRFNRSYEYDGLGDGYARFLLDELLPEVETKTASGGRKIVLSKSGNDRAIGGASQRRDLRVHRGVGAAGRVHAASSARSAPTSSLRGGDAYPDADPQVRAEADSRLPPGRQQRPEHLRRRLVDGEPGDGARACCSRATK